MPDSIPQGNTVRNDSLVITADSVVTDTNDSGNEVLKSKIDYDARDSIRVNVKDQVVHLYGDATVDYEDLHLKAGYIMIDMRNNELIAEGIADSTGKKVETPEYSQGEQNFRSNVIRYNFKTKKGKISYVITQEGEGYIHGEVVKKDPSNNFFISHGQYTTCNLDTPHFAISSNKLKVISNNKIVTGPAYLTIEQIPTPILIPFGFFPNKKGRSSGIIFPAFGESAQRGFYFQHLGYYFGFSDYLNLALTSDIYTRGSYTLDGASVYRKRYKYTGNVRVSYAYTINSEPELPDYFTRKDFHINWSHTQDGKARPNSTFSANVNAGTSSYYQNTISTVNNFLSNTFQSSVSYSHVFPASPFNLSMALNHSQNTITRDIRITAPDVNFNVSRIYPFKRKFAAGNQRWYEKIGTSLSVRGTNYIETKDSLLFREESLENLKNGVLFTSPFSTSFNIFDYFNLSPSLNFTYRSYFKTTEYAWNPVTEQTDTIDLKAYRGAFDYQAALGLTTRIYGMYLMNGFVKAVRHVATPSVSLAWRPDFSDENFGYYKKVRVNTAGDSVQYSVFQNNVFGGPAGGEFANLNFSLDNNIEMKVRTRSDTGDAEKKIKILESLRFASGYNLIADSMKLGSLNITGRTSILDRISFTFGTVLNPYAYDINNNDYDRFLSDVNGRLFRMTAANFTMNFSLNKINQNLNTSKYSPEELDYILRHPEEYVDFNVPYNLSVGYSYNYSKRGALESVITQSATFNGDVNLTPQWKIGFNSWYDITDGRFTNFGVNIYRDLHCWEMRLNWIPFGFQESYNFQINVKSSILQDLKLLKKKDFYDR